MMPVGEMVLLVISCDVSPYLHSPAACCTLYLMLHLSDDGYEYGRGRARESSAPSSVVVAFLFLAYLCHS
eukprot:scaffold790_cov149-Skeletonema_menzelii.AAC.5